MGRTRKNKFGVMWRSRAVDLPSRPFTLSNYNRPNIPKIDYANEFVFKARLSWSFQPEGGVTATPVEIEELSNILKHSEGKRANWTVLQTQQKFKAPAPTKPSMPPRPEPPKLPTVRPPKVKELPAPPVKSTGDFQPTQLQKIIPGLLEAAKRSAEAESLKQYELSYALWEKEVASIQAKNEAAQQAYDKAKVAQLQSPEMLEYVQTQAHWEKEANILELEHADATAKWNSARQAFEAEAVAEKERIEDLHKRYFSRDRDAVIFVTTLALRESKYPKAFPKNIEVQYKPDNRIVIITAQLPDFQSLIIVRNGIKIAQRERTIVSERALYAMAIRTLHETIAADELGLFSSVVFNGWVQFIDGATGHPRNEIILSVHSTKDCIKNLNIANVDPVECFRALKGVAAIRISPYTPVAPILVLNKDDDRLVEGQQVLDGLSPSDNLAALDWKVFEHLVRELFEREFSKPGTEVRVTRASRDRGVDAIVYDPDPIRGGKFIIQAKRYTNTVDVSSVRDLFGTVQAEGANRGILVTTSQYGPDAYEFGKEKNITLLDGNNLLSLFEKHGYRFRIDLVEARQLAANDATQGRDGGLK